VLQVTVLEIQEHFNSPYGEIPTVRYSTAT